VSRWELNKELEIEELRALMGKEIEFPTYVSPLLNLANKYAQATRPKVVGQMSDLIRECPYKDFEGWKRWYLSKHPKAIEEATNKIMEMLKEFLEVLRSVDRELVRKWVEDLVLVKTFLGLRVEEPILRYFAKLLGEEYRLSTAEEESKGIDGYIGKYSISIKPLTYKIEKALGESLAADTLIFYEKREGKIVIKEVEGLNEKGDEFVEKVKQSSSVSGQRSLNNFY